MTQEANPYLPQSSDVAEVADPRRLEPASRGRRFGTFVVDYIGFMLLAALIGVAVGLTLGDSDIRAIQRIPDFVFGVTIFCAYYVFFEAIWARTPGKWLFGTVVVDERGLKPSIGQVLGRTACRFIPFEVFSFFGAAGWHDSISKTRVVRASQLH